MSFFTQGRQLPPQTAGFTMAMLGIGGALGSFAIPFLSDQLGRKAGIIFAGFCTVIATFALAYWSVSLPSMMLCFFLMGFFGYGIFPVLPARSLTNRCPSTLRRQRWGSSSSSVKLSGQRWPQRWVVSSQTLTVNTTMAGAG